MAVVVRRRLNYTILLLGILGRDSYGLGAGDGLEGYHFYHFYGCVERCTRHAIGPDGVPPCI